jgi:hypothetical protein
MNRLFLLFCFAFCNSVYSQTTNATLRASLGFNWFVEGFSPLTNTFFIENFPISVRSASFRVFDAQGREQLALARFNGNARNGLTMDYDMGLFKPGSILRITLTDSDLPLLGRTVAAFEQRIGIIARPDWLTTATVSNISASNGLVNFDAEYPIEQASLRRNIAEETPIIGGKSYGVTSSVRFKGNYSPATRSTITSSPSVGVRMSIFDQPVVTRDMPFQGNPLRYGELNLDTNFALFLTFQRTLAAPTFKTNLPTYRLPLAPLVTVDLTAGLEFYPALTGRLVLGNVNNQIGFARMATGEASGVIATLNANGWVQGGVSVALGLASANARLTARGRLGGGVDFITVPNIEIKPVFGGSLAVSGQVKINALWGFAQLATFGPKTFLTTQFGDRLPGTLIVDFKGSQTSSKTYAVLSSLSYADIYPQPSLSSSDSSVVAVWLENSDNTGQLYLSSLNRNSNAFSTPTRITANQNSINNPKVAAISDGSAIISWSQNRYSSATLSTNASIIDVLAAQDIWLGLFMRIKS